MKASNRKITFKVLFGYIALGILAAISGWLVVSELRNFTASQTDDLKDRDKLIRISGLVADIYENESLSRAAVQLNTDTQFNAYLLQNDSLLSTIDTLTNLVNNEYQKALLDSVKVIFDKKQRDLNELRRLKENNSSEKSIEQTINKLKSIDPILGKLTLEDYVENPKAIDPKTKEVLEGFIQFSNDLKAKDSVSKVDQKQIDSIVTISRNMLNKIQKDAASQKQSLMLKERELVENDLITSRQLRNLLRTLEREMVASSQSIMAQRQKALDRSTGIIYLAALVSFILVVIFSIVILNDFWKSQQYREKLEKSNAYTNSLLKSREQLINMVSHDLRSPLSTISGYSELLQKTAQGTKEGNYLDHIKNASSYMSQLVDDLLEFSKLEDGHITVESIPFNLRTIVDETSSNIKAIYADKPIELYIKHAPELDRTLVSDPFRIKQVLYNLIGNAYKFTDHGSITISTQLHSKNNIDTVSITVSDTGIGISREKQEDIFNAFTQVDQTKDSKHSGFGLGLAISKKLVQILKGKLTLDSTPGRGSKFIITFPVKLSDVVLETTPTVSETSHFKLKAVIIDDDASLRQLLTDVLGQHNITTYTFEDAKAALAAMGNLKFDVVITDIQLPKMNGFHFLETLKKMPFYKQQPLIAMTGRTDIATENYIESGFSKVVFKPFSSHIWFDILSELFPERITKPEESKKIKSYSCDYFDTNSIAGFLNYDEDALKSLLEIFLKDTKKHMAELKTAQAQKDLTTITDLSHRMLTMFKQLGAHTIVPHLAKLEHTKVVDNEILQALDVELEPFCKAMEDYISPDYTP
ncbi:hybrid sensor histidine kinase/response regulator [Gelidibacter salicanalis]|uniref:histidine kinase n=1 Tax=Gelidibacter salicanalis TaxID=291193 RepID=A0A934KRB8_9FLAO|nr:hybrid sensor histidine kinase/response regulator [Gelidibacter salicanalis]MBJ7882099.1 response regulator [Gelidibacter salicanalis]